MYKPRREASEETSPTDTLVLDFLNFCCSSHPDCNMLVWQPEKTDRVPHTKSQLLWSSSVAQALSILLLYHLQHDLPSCLHLSQLEKKRGKREHTPSFYRHGPILVPTFMFYIWLQMLLGDQLGTQEWRVGSMGNLRHKIFFFLIPFWEFCRGPVVKTPLPRKYFKNLKVMCILSFLNSQLVGWYNLSLLYVIQLLICAVQMTYIVIKNIFGVVIPPHYLFVACFSFLSLFVSCGLYMYTQHTYIHTYFEV